MSLTPSLLVLGNAEEMANYHADVFPDGKLLHLLRTTFPGSQDEVVVTANIRIDGTDLLLVNSEDAPSFSDAVSLTITCADQAEVDYFWDRFVGDGGKPRDCAWCEDKFGFRWQVTPEELPKLLDDPEKGERAFAAMMTMQKIDIAAIKAAMES